MLSKENISVIVVDDLQFSCEVVKSGLKKAGYKDIRTSNSANDTLFMINDRRCDVIVADFWMPEMNGLEMTDLIRRWDENNNRYTGIILLTAEDTPSSVVVAFDRGVDDFLSKSASQYELAARVFGTGRMVKLQNSLLSRNRDLTNRFQSYQQLSTIDIETGLANVNRLKHCLSSMITHCESRGGGMSLCLIRINVDKGGDKEESAEMARLRKGTLRTIANSLQMVLRPMDQIARYDDCTFAIAIIYADNSNQNFSMFERSTRSILKHTHQYSDQGKKLSISMSTWSSDQFDPLPMVEDILDQAETDLHPLELAEEA